MAKRKAIGTALRFEVFKRDSFTCQYCGGKAPESVLELDHIEPVSKGGGNELLNLITSCWACNSGKSDRSLSDDTVVAKQHAQLAELQERREQLDMLLRWRDANADLVGAEEQAFAEQFSKIAPGWSLADPGRRDARRMISKFGLARSLDALDRAAAHKVVVIGGRATPESVDSLLGLAFVMAEPEEVQRLYRIRARIRRRWKAVHDGICIGILRRVLDAGASIQEIETMCDALMSERGTSFHWWRTNMESWMEAIANG